MKQTTDNDLDDFLKSHDIAKDIEKSIKEGCDNLYDVISESEYKDEFLENISSSDNFQKQHLLLEQAYQCRNIDGFMKKINEKNSYLKHRRTLKLTLLSTSVAVALVLLSFYLFNDIDSEYSKVEESTVILSSSVPVITVPSIIMQDSIIKLPAKSVVAEVAQISSTIEKIENLRLVIPKGYIYTIQLSDSTEVTLNAGSELIYPSQFAGEKREVELKGEAYFNVAKGKAPFIIKAENTSIKVYGTQFNVNSYNKDNIQTVLLKGSVGVSVMEDERMIKPNQMLTVNSKGVSKLTEVDAMSYVSWMKGEIVCNNESVSNFLDRIGKWYGVEFHHSDDMKSIVMSAEVKNNRPLEEVLKSIEIISEIKIIKVEKNKYMVKK